MTSSEKLPWARNALGIISVALLGVSAWVGLSWAPADGQMGDVQRIMYAHVPAVWGAMLALCIQFGCSIAYLIKGSWKADAMAEATAEVGVVLGATGVVLGAIWGRPTWGVYWTWDPRLTTSAILILAYLGVIALRRFVDDPDRRASWAAVASVIAFADIPIVWFSVRWWRSLHQVQSSTRTVDPHMQQALMVGGVALLSLTAYFIWTRYRIAAVRRQLELAPPELAGPSGLSNLPQSTPQEVSS